MHYSIEKRSDTFICLHILADADEACPFISNSEKHSIIDLADKLTEEILNREHLFPVSRMEYSGKESGDGGYDITVQFDILPEIPLPEIDSLTSLVPAPDMHPDEINHAFLSFRRRCAHIREVTRSPKEGDVLLIDVHGFLGEKPSEWLWRDGYQFRMDALQKKRMPEIYAVVSTLSPGEKGSGTMTCGHSGAADAETQQLTFEVYLKKVYEETLPLLDDSLANKLGFDSVRALEKKILVDAMAEHIAKIKDKAQHELLRSILDGLDFPIPTSILSFFTEEEQAQVQAHSTTPGWRKEELLERAKAHAKAHCFLLALANREGLSVNDKDIDEALTTLTGKKDTADVRYTLTESGAIIMLEQRLRAAKAFEYLYRKAHKNVVGE